MHFWQFTQQLYIAPDTAKELLFKFREMATNLIDISINLVMVPQWREFITTTTNYIYEQKTFAESLKNWLPCIIISFDFFHTKISVVLVDWNSICQVCTWLTVWVKMFWKMEICVISHSFSSVFRLRISFENNHNL